MSNDTMGSDLRFKSVVNLKNEGLWIKAAKLQLLVDLSDGRTVTVATDPVLVSDAEATGIALTLGIVDGSKRFMLLASTLDMVLNKLASRIGWMREQFMNGVSNDSADVDMIKAVIRRTEGSPSEGKRKLAAWMKELLQRRGHKL